MFDEKHTKKTVITNNRITSKIVFRLTQNFSYIRSRLCSRHLQSFKSVLQKTLCFTGAEKCARNELPGAAGTFGSGGQSSRYNGFLGHSDPKLPHLATSVKSLHGFDLRCNKDDFHESKLACSS